LEKSLQPHPAPVYLLLHAAEPYRRGALERIEAAVRPTIGLPAFNHGLYRASEAGRDALAAARTLPMMADRRLVVVRDLQEGTPAFYSSLVDYLKDPSPSTVLVLLGTGFPKVEKGTKRWSTPVEKGVKAAGGWVLDRKRELDPHAFATDRATALGKRLDRAAARTLVEVVGGDVGRLEREVEKLALYVGDAPEIRPADVDAVCALVAEAVIWDLTTALVKRDAAQSLLLLQRLQGDGLDPRHLLLTITWKLRSLLGAAAIVQGGGDERARAKAAGLRPYELKAARAALRDGLEGADVVLTRLARANRDMNGHRAGDHRILERLVVDWVT
jgi:DNA polymerase-3 subunit delta